MLLTVAPVTVSMAASSKGAAWPMNWLRKAVSFCTRCTKAASLADSESSTAMPLTMPCSSTEMDTGKVPVRPLA